MIGLTRMFVLLGFLAAFLVCGSIVVLEYLSCEVSPGRAGADIREWSRTRPTERPGGRNETDP